LEANFSLYELGMEFDRVPQVGEFKMAPTSDDMLYSKRHGWDVLEERTRTPLAAEKLGRTSKKAAQITVEAGPVGDVEASLLTANNCFEW
jgi:hypothetical protein